MIIHIASYPRSGNSWLQNLFGNQFKRLTTDIHDGRDKLRILEHWPLSNKVCYDIDVFPLERSESTKYGELSRWLLAYKFQEEKQIHKCILPGSLEQLNNLEVRNILSEDQDYYFLKTHLYPHSNYFEGEYVIQIVRNPGACLWSYYHFKRDKMKKNEEDLSSLIRSDSDYGSWSEYHREWEKAADILKSRYLLVRYEDLFGKELDFCKVLQSFLNLRIISTELRSFDFYH